MKKPKTIKPRWVPVHGSTEALEPLIKETLDIVRKLSEHMLTRDPSVMPGVRRKRFRILKCTQQLFDMLPGIVSRAEFMDWTGLDEHELREEVRAGRIVVYRPHPHGYARYYKHEIARLTGWKM